MNFKDLYTIEQRTAESKKIINKYPGLCPVILNVSNDSIFRATDIPTPDKFKYLVPNIQLSNFIFIIRRKLKVKEHTGLFFLINNSVIPLASELMHVLYEKYKDADGFLYLTVTSESVFGGSQQPNL